MSMRIDPEEMRAFQHREEHGHLPDDVYIPGPEDDPSDPDTLEIIEHVIEGYDMNNRKRAEERMRRRLSVLENLLTEHGIEIPEEH
jgi:hypothetical protein